MAASSQPIRLHDRVAVSRMGLGTVLFVGQTSFAAGLWVGVELDPGVAGGKNDGSVQGKRYFDTEPGQGVFVRTSQVEVLFEDGRDGEDEDQYDDEEAEETLMEENFPMVQATPQRQINRPPLGPSTSSSRTPMTRPRTSQLAPPSSSSSTRASSPQKPSVGSTSSSRSTSRPSLVSRTSAASSASASTSASRAPVAPSAAIARRTAAASTASSPSKQPAITPSRPGSSRLSGAAANSGRVSAASSISSTTSVRRPGSSVVASRNGSPTTPAATRVRPSIGGSTQASSSAFGPRSTATRPTSTAATAPRPSIRSTEGQDAQATAARSALRPSVKTRPSMAPTQATPRAGVSTQPNKRQPGTPAGQQDDSPGLSADHEDHFQSPSAAARERLNAARQRNDHWRVSDGADRSLSSEAEDDEDLLALDVSGSASQRTAPNTSPAAQAAALSSAEASSLKREVEELRVKNRLNEKRREEERTRVKELEKWKEDVSEKLRIADNATAKAQNLSAQLLALQTTEQQLSLEKTELEDRIEDLTEQLEMAALDREVAEEKAEAALADIETLKADHEELTLEVEVLREENALYEHGPVDENERSSTGWIQLEKQNERLKEALIRLRDATQESDHDQKRRISELEKELAALGELQDSRDTLAAKLEASEAQLEDVKVQLDDALGAEEMLEELTERNLFLGEKMGEMASAIEELEALKELNEELEEMHAETEKQLQEEVDLKDMMIRERNGRVEALEANANEYEGTFAQFRELVVNLQGDVEALRAERDGLVEEGQNAQLNSQSREMLSLNMKLQSSALKSQARTIDAELSKMRTDQALLHLKMVQPYLPAAFAQEGDRDALAGLLFFERMSTKANIIKTVVESHHDVAKVLSSLNVEENDGATNNAQLHAASSGSIPEGIVGVCQLRHSLAHFSAVCSSVAAMLRVAPAGTFLKCGRLYKEIQSVVEPRIDAFVEALRKEELKEAECSAEFKRFVRQFEELSFTLMVAQEEEIQRLQAAASDGEQALSGTPTGDGDLAAKEAGSATLLDIDLDTLCASLSSAKQTLSALQSGYGPENGVEWQLDGHTLEERFFEPLNRLLTDVRATKGVARKLLRRLSNLAVNDEAVAMDAIGGLPSLGRLSSKLVAFATTLHTSIVVYTDEIKTSRSPFALDAMVGIIKEAGRELRMDDGTAAYVAEESEATHLQGDVWKEALDATAHLTKTINGLVAGATAQDNVIKISGVGPWQGRSLAVQAIASHNAEVESQVLKLQDDLRDLYQQIKARDAALSEGGIKIERLQRQLEKTKVRDEAHEETKSLLAQAKEQAKAYQDANEALQSELDGMEKVNETLRRGATASAPIDGADGRANAGDTGAKDATSTRDSGNAPSLMATNTPYAGMTMPSAHLETDYLLSQVEAMRASLKYLREENALLKASDFQRELDALPSLSNFASLSSRRAKTLGKVNEGEAETEDIVLMGVPHKKRVEGPRSEDLRNAEGERKHLYSSLLHFAATKKIIELPAIRPRPGATSSTASKTEEDDARSASLLPSSQRQRPAWRPLSSLPSSQYEAQLSAAERLAARFSKLQERSQVGVGGGGKHQQRQQQHRASKAGGGASDVFRLPLLTATGVGA